MALDFLSLKLNNPQLIHKLVLSLQSPSLGLLSLLHLQSIRVVDLIIEVLHFLFALIEGLSLDLNAVCEVL